VTSALNGVLVRREADFAAVTRPARVVAHLIPLVVMPSAVWRTVLSFGVPLGFDRALLEADHIPGWGTLQLAFLTILTEALALASFALVRPWGEVVPHWVPRLRGRRIPPKVVTVPAATGAVVLTLIWTFAIAGLFTGRTDEVSGAGWLALIIACYIPAVAWGPLLLWLTVDYHRRRRPRSS
jgi:hypothetical protein